MKMKAGRREQSPYLNKINLHKDHDDIISCVLTLGSVSGGKMVKDILFIMMV